MIWDVKLFKIKIQASNLRKTTYEGTETDNTFTKIIDLSNQLTKQEAFLS